MASPSNSQDVDLAPTKRNSKRRRVQKSSPLMIKQKKDETMEGEEDETPVIEEKGVFEQMAGIDPDEAGLRLLCGLKPNGNGWNGPQVSRNSVTKELLFKDFKDFRPNLTPQEVKSQI